MGGLPVGILTQQGGIAICETAENTPPGTFTCQDLAMLRMEVPLQWQEGGT